jgi:outer membrane biosynthesis protein TonB
MTTGYFSYVRTEQKNSIKGTVYAILVHLLLLLIFFLKMFDITPPEDPEQPPYLSLVEFIPVEKMKEYDNAGGSKGDEGLETLEGGSQGNQEQTPEPEPEPVAEKKVEETPVEKIPTQTPAGPKPVLTSTEPDVVKLPSPPKLPPSTKPTTDNGSTASNPSTTPSKSTSSSSSGDNDHPGSGGTGTGSGSGQGAGDANAGSGTGAGGGSGTGGGGGTGGGAGAGTGSGTGDGVGVDFDEIGPLKRQRELCPDMKTLAGPVVQEAAFNICIDREGNIKFCSFNSKASKTKDINFVRKSMNLVKQCKFKPNPSAPKKECGVYTLRLLGIQQKLN